MKRPNYLNVGCGSKFHTDWTNVDMRSGSPHVQSCNLLKGIPFPNDSFDVIYQSQLLEHFPREKAFAFIMECHRVLKPGGTMRVVVPDLENIVKEYLRCLNVNLNGSSAESEANYDWIMDELYDQTVRNASGGHMAETLGQPTLINEGYIFKRTGYSGIVARDYYLSKRTETRNKSPSLLKVVGSQVLKVLRSTFLSRAQRTGSFRLGGEVHLWMYDRFSLARLLLRAGFEESRLKNPFDSDIPQWGEYELDVKDGAPFDPASLFMEAKKPLIA